MNVRMCEWVLNIEYACVAVFIMSFFFVGHCVLKVIFSQCSTHVQRTLLFLSRHQSFEFIFFISIISVFCLFAHSIRLQTCLHIFMNRCRIRFHFSTHFFFQAKEWIIEHIHSSWCKCAWIWDSSLWPCWKAIYIVISLSEPNVCMA